MGPGKGSEAWLKFGQVKNLCQLLEPEGLWWDPELSIHSAASNGPSPQGAVSQLGEGNTKQVITEYLKY